MLVELLEKFEDVFQPLDSEEAERRAPFYIVRVYPHKWAYDHGESYAKEMKIKATADTIVNKILKILGIHSESKLSNVHYNNFIIGIGKNTNLEDDEGRQMEGAYVVRYKEID